MAESIQEMNQALASKINEEARRNPQSPYCGRFVGIVSGQVVAVHDNLDDVVRSVRQIEADASKVLCIEAGLDYAQSQDIWSR